MKMELQWLSVFQIFHMEIDKTKQQDHLFLKNMKNQLNMLDMIFLLGGNIQAMFQEFESYHKTKVGLAAEDLQLILKTM